MLFLSTKKLVAGQIKNIVVPAPIATAPHKIFIMRDEEGEHSRRTAARRYRADDTLPLPHCRQHQRCAAAAAAAVAVAYVLCVVVVVISIAIATAAFN
jgi:hypothetical protein